jgi:hypothetical protein
MAEQRTGWSFGLVDGVWLRIPGSNVEAPTLYATEAEAEEAWAETGGAAMRLAMTIDPLAVTSAEWGVRLVIESPYPGDPGRTAYRILSRGGSGRAAL